MNKELVAFLNNMKHKFGTHKFRVCLGMALLNFIALSLALEDKPEPQNNLIENNKEEN